MKKMKLKSKDISEFEGLCSFEEINSYSLVETSKKGKIKQKIVNNENVEIKKISNKQKLKKFTDNNKNKDLEGSSENITIKATSTKKVKKKNPPEKKSAIKRQRSPSPEHEVSSSSSTKSKKKFNQKHSKKSPKSSTSSFDETEWRALCTPDDVIASLRDLGFVKPTPIQKCTIPDAIRDGRDIIGAAETGSGKTLAFVIPIIDGILKEKDKELHDDEEFNDTDEELNDHDSDQEPDDEKDDSGVEYDEESEFEQSESDIESDEFETSEEVLKNKNEGTGLVNVIENVDFDFLPQSKSNNSLKALIVTPTRELAIQIQKHTEAVLSKTSLRCVALIGGLSHAKQERLLNLNPEIVIGTPGRLWELYDQGNEHLSQLQNIKFLAVDESDRMVETGHFEELRKLLNIINGNPEAQKQRQNFVFSATLTLAPSFLGNKNKNDWKKKKKTVTSEMKLNKLMEIIGVRAKAKVVDLSGKHVTSHSLSEAKIFCDNNEKDVYLYYFLKRFPGRTLVFCNSIDCVKRLSNLLILLRCSPLALYALKHQKQRLSVLEKFKNNPISALLSTDVTARGIDIPCVDHIVHYELPKTAETYVHRSGRTARADREGLSVLLIGNDEVHKYQKMCHSLKRDSLHSSFPVSEDLLQECRQRVVLAHEIETSEYGHKKKKNEENWFKKMAEESEIAMSDSNDDDEVCANSIAQSKFDAEQRKRRAQLSQLLARPIARGTFSSRYPTLMGKFMMPDELVCRKADAALDLFKERTKAAPKFAFKAKRLKNKRNMKKNFKAKKK